MRIKVLGIQMSTRAAFALAILFVVLSCGVLTISLISSSASNALMGTTAQFAPEISYTSAVQAVDPRIQELFSSNLSANDLELRLNQYQMEDPELASAASTAIFLYERQLNARSLNTANAYQREITQLASMPTPERTLPPEGNAGGAFTATAPLPTQESVELVPNVDAPSNEGQFSENPMDENAGILSNVLEQTRASIEINATRFAVESAATFAALSAISTQQALLREQLELARQQTAAANPDGGTPIAQVIDVTPSAQLQPQTASRATVNMSDTFDVVNMVVNGVGIIVGVVGAWIGYKAMRVEAMYRQQIASGNAPNAPQIVESTARPITHPPDDEESAG